MLAPNPTVAAPTWPIPGDVPDLMTIVTDQSKTVAANAALIDAYQGNLNAVQSPSGGSPATGTGTSAGTSLSVTSVTGTIVTGATVTGTGVPAATSILGQISGTVGGAGTYLTSQSTTLSNVALTFTPPPGASTWPVPRDADTLNSITQIQTAITRTQNALLAHYQDLLNTSQVSVPPTGP